MSFVMVGDTVYDSKEILKDIKNEFEFQEIKDLTSSSKRDDTLVYQIYLDANVLKDEIESDMDVEGIDDSELVEELLTSCDEQIMLIEDFIPEDFIGYAYTYNYDKDMDILKAVFIAADKKLGESKLKEIAERILKSLD
ncbi:hypothetical protein [Serpentinicella alkaliphila]|uniref:Uncharacterized protein n=1 Tax=Serpentinicella alkaliphila TaxID=1734049 RepID=A0A4R2TER9_9FIRM|nr:hypothetical protein [Serpentinicella alkaliphila]QUH25393.1 hypothetical protein HZR23_06155 [Serpentinicella alkaliphila]TCQ01571.1 hypothetical protein EDD79_102637 [Serpentinicella alkaliphila]